MKKLFSISLFLVAFCCMGQISYDNSDMAGIGDTIRISETNIPLGMNYAATDTNFTWDFSQLTQLRQRVDTFLNIFSTPIFYYPAFITVANMAIPQNYPQLSIPGLSLSSAYNYIKSAASDFSMAGFALMLSGLPVIAKYDTMDYIYKFPVTIGNQDSSTTSFNISIPGLGYIEEIKKRINFVDGWGTVITPYGSFPCVRMKSDLYIHDTIFYAGTGFTQDRHDLEYRWLVKGYGLPMIKITESMLFPMAEYIDSVRQQVSTGIIETSQPLNEAFVYPNPTSGNCNLNYYVTNAGKVTIDLFSTTGQLLATIEEEHPSAGNYTVRLPLENMNISKEIIFARITSAESIKMLKIIVAR